MGNINTFKLMHIMYIKILTKQEFNELAKEAINCLVKPNCIKYRLDKSKVLIDYGNGNLKLIERLNNLCVNNRNLKRGVIHHSTSHTMVERM